MMERRHPGGGRKDLFGLICVRPRNISPPSNAFPPLNPLKVVQVLDPASKAERLRELKYPVGETPKAYVCLRGTCTLAEDPKVAENGSGGSGGSPLFSDGSPAGLMLLLFTEPVGLAHLADAAERLGRRGTIDHVDVLLQLF